MDAIRRLGKRPFQFTAYSAVQFVVLTIIAMFFYPGGTITDHSTSGYSFFRNFFSSLGLTVAPNGEPNTIAAILFFIALSVAGLGLVVYFIAEPQFFWHSRSLRITSIVGSIVGVFTGICFMGVAFTPANLFRDAHSWFVLNAFRSFLVAAIVYAIAILLNKDYPNRYAGVYLLFAVLLAAYIWLMINGPGLDTVQGEMVQVTGQKIIVYASIICMLVQSVGSIRLSVSENTHINYSP